MTRHMLMTRTFLPLPRNEVFPFFADAMNLERITPPELNFKVLTPSPISIQEGTLIDYRIQLFVVPMTWRTLIARWNPPEEFMDKQLVGPYAFWEHTHCFYQHQDGTVMEDVVHYELPLGMIGAIGHPLIRLQLNRIFEYREYAVRQCLLV